MSANATPAPVLRMDTTWNLGITTPDLRLVLRALRGVIEDEGEKERAFALAGTLSRARAQQTEHALRENSKLLANLDAETPPGEGPTRAGGGFARRGAGGVA